MNSRTHKPLVLLVACSLLLTACSTATTPAPTIPPTDMAEPTVAPPTVAPPTAAPTAIAPAAPTPHPAQVAATVDIAWEYIIQPDVDVVANVNGVDIGKEAYLAELLTMLRTVTLAYRLDWTDPSDQAFLPSFQEEVLQQMMKSELARQLAAAEGLTIDDDQRATGLAKVQDGVLATGQHESWEDYLNLLGHTQETFDQQLTTLLIYQALLQAHSAPAEVEHVHAAHILVETEETGNEVLEKLAAGESFSDLVEEYSIDKTAGSDGDLSWFPRGMMVPEFEDAAFALEPGEISGLVQTSYGYHIIHVLEKEVRLLNQQTADQVNESLFQLWFDEQLAAADVETFVEFVAPTA